MDSRTKKIVSIIGGVAALVVVCILAFLTWNSYRSGGSVAKIYSKAKGLVTKPGISKIILTQASGDRILDLIRIRLFDSSGKDITQDTTYKFEHTGTWNTTGASDPKNLVLPDFDPAIAYHSAVVAGKTQYVVITLDKPLPATKLAIYTRTTWPQRFLGATVEVYKRDGTTLAFPKFTTAESKTLWEFVIPEK